nr:MAG TPA: hypothetical protein [Caudoviricetes sp.]
MIKYQGPSCFFYRTRVLCIELMCYEDSSHDAHV